MEKSVKKLKNYFSNIRIELSSANSQEELLSLFLDYYMILRLFHNYYSENPELLNELKLFNNCLIKNNIKFSDIISQKPEETRTHNITVSQSLKNFSDKYIEKIFKDLYFTFHSDEELNELIKSYIDDKATELKDVYKNLNDDLLIKLPKTSRDFYNFGANYVPKSHKLDPLILVNNLNYFIKSLVIIHELSHIHEIKTRRYDMAENLSIDEIYPHINEKNFFNYIKEGKLVNNLSIKSTQMILDILTLDTLSRNYQSKDNMTGTPDYLIARALRDSRDSFSSEEIDKYLNSNLPSNDDYLAIFGESEETVVKEKVIKKNIKNRYGFAPFRGLY